MMIHQHWYYRQGSASAGPVAWPRLRSMARMGELSPESEVRQGDHGDWVRASEVPGLCKATDIRALPAVARSRNGHPSPTVVHSSERPADNTNRLWHCRILGEELGPVSLETLKEMAASTELSMSDEIRSVNQTEWVSAASLSDLWTKDEALCDALLTPRPRPAKATQKPSRKRAATNGIHAPSSKLSNGHHPVDAVHSKVVNGDCSSSVASEHKKPEAPLILQAILEISITTSGGSPQVIRAPIRLPMSVSDSPGSLPPVALRLSFNCDADFSANGSLNAAGADLPTMAAPVMASAAPQGHPALTPTPFAIATTPVNPVSTPANPAYQENPGDAWFCKIGEREYGPIRLEELIAWARHERIWKQTPIRHGQHGAWFAAGECEELFAPASVARNVSAEVQTGSAKTPPSRAEEQRDPSAAAGALIHNVNRLPYLSKSREKTERQRERVPLGTLVRDNAKALGIAGGLALLLLIWFFPYSNQYSTLLADVQNTYTEFIALREQNADEAQWEDLQARTEALYRDRVKELERNASPDDPASQCLLWALRDYLPKMLQEARMKKTTSEEKFEENLVAARGFIHPVAAESTAEADSAPDPTAN
jgi:hypothetical protein